MQTQIRGARIQSISVQIKNNTPPPQNVPGFKQVLGTTTLVPQIFSESQGVGWDFGFFAPAFEKQQVRPLGTVAPRFCAASAGPQLGSSRALGLSGAVAFRLCTVKPKISGCLSLQRKWRSVFAAAMKLNLQGNTAAPSAEAGWRVVAKATFFPKLGFSAQLFGAAPSARLFYKPGLTCEELSFAHRPPGRVQGRRGRKSPGKCL